MGAKSQWLWEQEEASEAQLHLSLRRD